MLFNFLTPLSDCSLSPDSFRMQLVYLCRLIGWWQCLSLSLLIVFQKFGYFYCNVCLNKIWCKSNPPPSDRHYSTARPTVKQPMSQQSICMLQYHVINLTANYVYRPWDNQLPSIRHQNVSGHPGHYQGAQNIQLEALQVYIYEGTKVLHTLTWEREQQLENLNHMFNLVPSIPLC